MRKLRLEADFRDALEDFSPEDLGRLVAVAGLLAKNPNAEVTF